MLSQKLKERQGEAGENAIVPRIASNCEILTKIKMGKANKMKKKKLIKA